MLQIHLTSELVATTAAVVIPVAGLAVGYMRLSMSNAIRGLKLDLIKELNGTYTRKGECQIAHTDLKDRLIQVEREVEKIDREVQKMDRHLSARLVPLESLTHSKWEPLPPAAAIVVTGERERDNEIED